MNRTEMVVPERGWTTGDVPSRSAVNLRHGMRADLSRAEETYEDAYPCPESPLIFRPKS
jgi:hypothetical protein